MSRLTEVKITRDPKYSTLCTKLDKPISTKIIWGYPDIVEMTDKDGKVHTYSIIELLDGLKALAKKLEKEEK